uniref:Replication factor C subunit 1 n=1 Tax=Globisporangium ultimum (strain ATCC 200006 / CBS 805.95 / DAOM BR144) TaxID=431595 RepID=K3WVL0_GLOUD
MDIRSFFQKQSGSATAKPKAAAALAKPKAAVHESPKKVKKPGERKETPTRRTPSRRAKKNVVVLDSDDDDFDDISTAKVKDEDVVEMVKPAPQRKRLRRALDNDGDDSEVEEVPKPQPSSVKKENVVAEKAQPAKKMAPSALSGKSVAVPVSVKQEADGVKKENEDVDMTPIRFEAAVVGKAPEPCAGCLDGKTFAFSGQLHNLSREDAIHLVKSCGGSVSNTVTRTTKYLIAGETLPDGEDISSGSKYKEAVAKNVRILQQNQFYNLITEAAADKQLEILKKEKQVEKLNAACGGASGSNGKQKLTTSVNDMLWTDKYKPKRLEDMIGNVELGKKLKQWLLDWDAVHVKGTKKIPFTTKLADNRGAKTILLSGPPGIGKTTIANLIARECGFECTELNASDTRSKKMLQTGLKDVLGSRALQFGPASGSSKDKMHLAKRVIVMDEVDGMSGGDRGGTAELILLIKKSKTPIICICNDRQSQKVRSLANHSYDLRMRRPTKQQIGKRLMEIGALEGLEIEKNAIEEAADRCGNDIRQLITQMQKWRLTSTKVTYADMVNPSSQHNKDESLRLNPFSATQMIFQRETSFDARNEAYFVDYDFMPLMVQENYIQSIMNNRNTSDEKLEAAMNASQFIAESDLVSNYVRAEQRWDLLTKQAALNVAACVYSSGFIGHPEFSRWLGKNSSAGKSKRLLSELSVRMRAHASGSREVIRMDYVPYMKEILLQKLLSGDEHIDEVIELLDSCEISREDLTESMESFKFPGIKRHSYAELDTKAKSGFTRQYNKAVHKAQGVVESALGSTTIKKGRGKAAAIDDDDALPPASDAESEPEGDDDDDIDISKFQKKAKGGGRTASGDAKPKRKAPAAKAKTAPAKKRKA